MSLSSLKSEIGRLESLTRNLNDEALGGYDWKQQFIRVLEGLSQVLEDMDYSIDELEHEQRQINSKIH